MTALSGGLDITLGQGLHLVGDANWVFTGENTYTTQYGILARGSTYGAALRYTGLSGKNGFGIDLGVTNALGSSTGFSLTPDLGNAMGFYAAIHFHF